jgi:2-Cys peroxiredoxin 5
MLSRAFSSASKNLKMITVGSKIPSAVLFENTPGGAVKTEELFAGKKVVLIGLPGAFTPGCSATHLPGYVAAQADLKAKGVAEVVCVSVNDPFVMAAWGKAHGCDGKVRMLADTTAAFTKALGLDLDLTAALGGVRCKRFSAVVDDGTVTKLSVEPADAPTGMTCSLAEKLIL